MGFDEWLTDPETVLPRARRVMPTIDLDPASNLVAQQYVQAQRFAVAPDYMGPLPANCTRNGLAIEWRANNIWLNPPYSAGLIDAFTAKLLAEWRLGRISQALYLVNSSTDAGWFHDALAECNAMLLWRGRIKYWKIFNEQAHKVWEGEKSKADRVLNPELKPKIGNSPMYQNALFYFGYNLDTFLAAFGDCGTVVKAVSTSVKARQSTIFDIAA